jgi:hypothetical protein
MNKKFVYSLVLTSIFIMSIVAVCIQPAAGANWKFGVPKEAVGMKLQSEVKVYDKDLWGDCIGLDSDDRASLATGSYRKGFSSDGDNVGARSQSEITDWQSEDYWFMGDSLLWTWMDESVRMDPELDRTGDGKSDLQTYWDGVWFAERTIAGLANRTDTVGTLFNKPLIYTVWGLASKLYAGLLAGYGFPAGCVTLGNVSLLTNLQNDALDSSYSKEEVAALFHKTYEAKVVQRDAWYWDKDADFDDPDEEDADTPFIVNPEDLFDSWVYFFSMVEELLSQAQDVVNKYDTAMYSIGWSTGLLGTHTYKDGSSWDALNRSMYLLGVVAGLPAEYQAAINAPVAFGGFGRDAPFGLWMIVSMAIEELLIDFFRSKIPDRGEYLLILLKAGIPAHQDVGKWLEKMVDAFSIDDEKYYDSIYGDPFKLDVSVDGLVVTAKIEWKEGVCIDESKPWSEENQREDYEIVFTYGDTGGQSTKEYICGDDIFYKTESIAPTIPGYEVSILLGAGAIATLGLIFVVIKKRRM